MARYLAVDLGAESGRLILGTLEKGRLDLKELHRFPNGARKEGNALVWDIETLWREIRAGMAKAAPFQPDSIGVDSWALDYVLMRDGKRLDRAPRCYRDARTDQPYRSIREKIGENRIYTETGIQFMPINTLYHLVADRDAEDQPLLEADQFLMIGDWFHYLMTGRVAQEESNASTTQLWDPVKRGWAADLIRELEISEKIFPQGVPPCTQLGPLLPELQTATGLTGIPVIAGCVHDTGAAVAAVPAEGSNWAYLSSGTWSLIGVELSKPLINETARKANFTNEIGVNGTSRFLKNASGMWLIQECRRIWASEGTPYSYAEIADMARNTPPATAWLNPDDQAFLRPDHMPNAIVEACRKTSQPEPTTHAEISRIIFESLAVLYGTLLDQLERVTGRKLDTLHIVGGGSQNELLNQMTADASGRRVIAGPIEATAIGNVLLQALTLGHIKSLEELRNVVRQSFSTRVFEPQNTARWMMAKEQMSRLRH